MKIVKGFSNKQSNDYCLQACVRSVLDFYFKGREFSETEINLNTQYHSGHFSWSPATVAWLDNLGLDVTLFVKGGFNYQEFANTGLKYLRKLIPNDDLNRMLKRGDYYYLSEILESAKNILKSKLVVNHEMKVNELEHILEKEDALAIGKTMYEWLDNDETGRTNHYVVIDECCDPGKWRIEDPGPNFFPNRKVDQLMNNESKFPELIVIRGYK